MFVQLYTINSTNLGGNRVRGGSTIFPITQRGPDGKRLETTALMYPSAMRQYAIHSAITRPGTPDGITSDKADTLLGPAKSLDL